MHETLHIAGQMLKISVQLILSLKDNGLFTFLSTNYAGLGMVGEIGGERQAAVHVKPFSLRWLQDTILCHTETPR